MPLARDRGTPAGATRSYTTLSAGCRTDRFYRLKRARWRDPVELARRGRAQADEVVSPPGNPAARFLMTLNKRDHADRIEPVSPTLREPALARPPIPWKEPEGMLRSASRRVDDCFVQIPATTWRAG